METNAELHPFSRGVQRHLALNLRCAENRFNDAAELGEDAITHQLDDAAVMFGNRWFYQFRALGL